MPQFEQGATLFRIMTHWMNSTKIMTIAAMQCIAGTPLGVPAIY